MQWLRGAYIGCTLDASGCVPALVVGPVDRADLQGLCSVDETTHVHDDGEPIDVVPDPFPNAGGASPTARWSVDAALSEALWRFRHRRVWDSEAPLRFYRVESFDETADGEPAPASHPSVYLRRLEQFGTPGGPTEAIACDALARLRERGHEQFAVESLLAGGRGKSLPETPRAHCARVLFEHGESTRALRLLEDATSAEALLLKADILESRADSAWAIATADRALGRDVGVAGGTERLGRWTEMLARTREVLFAKRLEANPEEGQASAPPMALGPLPVVAPPLRTKLRIVEALDARGQRARAIEAARELIEEEADAGVAELLEQLVRRLLRPPWIDVAFDERPLRIVLGESALLGRVGVDVCVPSPCVSRRHVLLRRADGVPVIEDLTANHGTTIAGARISGPLPVAGGVSLDLAGTIRCVVAPLVASDPRGPVAVDVADRRTIAALGAEVSLGPWRLALAREGEPRVVLTGTPTDPLYLGEAPLLSVDLAHGDCVRASPGGPVRLRVLARA